MSLGEYITVTTRTRYNVWDLLSDVGGFNDGLFLVASIVMSSYSAFQYKKDLLSQFKVDGDSKSSNRSHSRGFKTSLAYNNVAHSIKNGSFQNLPEMERDDTKVFSWGLKKATILKHNFFMSLQETFKCADKKERKVKEKLLERIDNHLDI